MDNTNTNKRNTNMNKNIAIITATLLSFGLFGTACSEAEIPTNTSTEIEVSAFRVAAQSEGIYISELSDGDITEFGDVACLVASESGTVDELISVILVGNAGSGLDDFDAGYLVGSAIGIWCPTEAARLGLS